LPTGDGLYMVFGSVSDAGNYALELNRLVTGTDWSARGLPGGLNIRIALHCGPVYVGRNPVTGFALYTGPHTSRTARIEPITPPGQVYASSAFAAVAAAIGIDSFALQYVGRMQLAKGYGPLGLYHVCSA
jgi:adenylate cyclase